MHETVSLKTGKKKKLTEVRTKKSSPVHKMKAISGQLRTSTPVVSDKLHRQSSKGRKVNSLRYRKEPFIHTHEVSKSSHWQAAGSSNKLQKSHPLLVINFFNKLLTSHSRRNTSQVIYSAVNKTENDHFNS